MSEREGPAKTLWEAGHGRNEIARRTGIPRSTITRWMKRWEAEGARKGQLQPVVEEEERLRGLARSETYEVPETVWIQNEEERQQYLHLLLQAKGDHTRIARRGSGGPFVLLPPPPPPMSRKDQYDLVYGKGTREEKKRRMARKRIREESRARGATHPPGYMGE